MMPTDNSLTWKQHRAFFHKETKARRLFPILLALTVAIEVAAALFMLAK